MSIVLNHQVEASERSAEALERAILYEHRSAMQCYDVENLMRSLVTLHDCMKRDVEHWQDMWAAGSQDVRAQIQEHGAEWDRRYRKIGAVFHRAHDLMKALERDGHTMQGKREFLDSWRELRATLSFSLDRVSAAADQVRRGEVRPLGEVMHELWDKPVR